MTEHTELPWRHCKLEGLWHTIEALDGQRIARLCNNKAANAEFIILACNTFADIEEGVSMIVRKDHYYAMEAQNKDLLIACEALKGRLEHYHATHKDLCLLGPACPEIQILDFAKAVIDKAKVKQ